MRVQLVSLATLCKCVSVTRKHCFITVVRAVIILMNTRRTRGRDWRGKDGGGGGEGIMERESLKGY